MSCDFLTLATAGVQKLQPYQPGKPMEELERELGLTEIIKLASNENPLGPGARARAAVRAQIDELGRYPGRERICPQGDSQPARRRGARLGDAG